MRSIYKKAACMLASAVLFCGAGSINAGAAKTPPLEPTKTISGPITTQPILQVAKFSLDKTDVEITQGGYDIINVKKASSYTLPEGATLTYKWFFNGNEMAVPETSSGIMAYDPGDYYCQVTVKTPMSMYANGKKIATAYTTSTYETRSANVHYKFEITSQSKSFTRYSSGERTNIFVTVKGGTSPYTYEWKKDGVAFSTSRSTTISSAGTYLCKITDSKGRELESAPIVVKNSYLTLTKDVKDSTIYDYSTGCQLSVAAKGGKGSYTYKWYCDGTKLSDTTAEITARKAGKYYCIITDSANNTVTSRTATVKTSYLSISKCLKKYLSYLIDANGSYIPATEPLRVYVNATGGTGKYTYTWQKYYRWSIGGKDVSYWQNIKTTSNNYIDLEGDDVTYTVTNYDEFYKPYTYTYYGIELRCLVSSVDANGKVVTSEYTPSAAITRFDLSVPHQYD
jgi:hypothetical protein